MEVIAGAHCLSVSVSASVSTLSLFTVSCASHLHARIVCKPTKPRYTACTNCCRSGLAVPGPCVPAFCSPISLLICSIFMHEEHSAFFCCRMCCFTECLAMPCFISPRCSLLIAYAVLHTARWFILQFCTQVPIYCLQAPVHYSQVSLLQPAQPAQPAQPGVEHPQDEQGPAERWVRAKFRYLADGTRVRVGKGTG